MKLSTACYPTGHHVMSHFRDINHVRLTITMHKSYAIFYSQVGLFALVVVLALIATLVVAIRAVRSKSRERGIAELKMGLVGGLFFTSSPFYTLVYGLSGISYSGFLSIRDSFLSFLGMPRHIFSWWPYFLIGFGVSAVGYATWRSLRREKPDPNDPGVPNA